MVDGRQLRRSSVGFGVTGYRYNYNGGDRPANPIPEWLRRLTEALEQFFGQSFEHALLTLFPPDSGLGEHSDNESEIFSRSIIACLSLLGRRCLQVVNKSSGDIVLTLPLEPGSLYTMEGAFQEFLLHRIQQDSNPRASITWRHLRPPDHTPMASDPSPALPSPKKPKRKQGPSEEANSYTTEEERARVPQWPGQIEMIQIEVHSQNLRGSIKSSLEWISTLLNNSECTAILLQDLGPLVQMDHPFSEQS